MSDTTTETDIYKIFINVVEIMNVLLFLEFQAKGEITKELEADYKEFSNTLREVYEKEPEVFLFDKVYLKIPKNKWTPIFQKNYDEMVNEIATSN